MKRKAALILFVSILVLIGSFLLGPTERTLGTRLRLVLLHGAWVWTGKALFLAAAFAGLLGLLKAPPHSISWPGIARASSLTGLGFWLTYLPMSVLVMKQTWGGIAWEEPRWRVPLLIGLAAVLLQAALWLVRSDLLTCLVNLGFGPGVWYLLGRAENQLHPVSPVFSSNSWHIQAYFLLLLGLCGLCAIQIAVLINHTFLKKL
jgi:hypothetical protein